MEMLEFNKEFVERTRNIVLSQCKDEFVQIPAHLTTHSAKS